MRVRQRVSPVFGEVIEPASVGELFKWLNKDHYRSEAIGRPYIWRGQADMNWPVHSTAYRRLAASGRAPTERDLDWYERTLLEQARHRGYGEIDGHRLSDFDLLARIRHHGGATRLVDATRSAAVGLWFAACEQVDTAGALIGLHTDFLGGLERKPEDREYGDVVNELADLGHPMTWEPPGVSARIAAQHAQFLYSEVVESPAGSLVMEPCGSGSTLVMAIAPRLKRELLDTLPRVFDITSITLFPDIDGFGMSNGAHVARDDMWRW